MSADEFSTEITVEPGYDHREESHNKGCHGARLVLILRGPDAVLTCPIMTDWMPRPLRSSYLSVKGSPTPWPRHDKPGFDAGRARGPEGAGVHLHCAEQRKDWWRGSDRCDYIEGTCYGDSGYIVSDTVVDALVSGGSAAAFDRMREIYDSWMSEGQS